MKSSTRSTFIFIKGFRRLRRRAPVEQDPGGLKRAYRAARPHNGHPNKVELRNMGGNVWVGR
jgi:hypothetical protein